MLHGVIFSRSCNTAHRAQFSLCLPLSYAVACNSLLFLMVLLDAILRDFSRYRPLLSMFKPNNCQQYLFALAQKIFQFYRNLVLILSGFNQMIRPYYYTVNSMPAYRTITHPRIAIIHHTLILSGFNQMTRP